MDDAALLERIKEVNKVRPKKYYFKNAFLKISGNVSLALDMPCTPLAADNLIELHCHYESTFVKEWQLFVPLRHNKLCATFHVYTCEQVISFITANEYPFKHTVCIYEVEAYFRKASKQYNKLMKNPNAMVEPHLQREQFDRWLLNGVLMGYSIQTYTSDRLILMLTQYAKMAAYAPYHQDNHHAIAQCASTNEQIWLRMLENIPRLRKSDLATILQEHPTLLSYLQDTKSHTLLDALFKTDL